MSNDFLIEDFLRARLADLLDVPVGLQEPQPPAQRYVVLQKTGSRCVNYLHSASFAVQSCAPTKAGAAELNEQAKAALLRLLELDNISKVDIETDYDFTDPARKVARWQALVRLTYYPW